MLKDTLEIWQKTAVSLGLFGLIMTVGFALLVLAPIVVLGPSLLGMILMMVLSLIGVFIYTIYWCAGYVAIDNYIETGNLQISTAFSTISERMVPIFVGMVLISIASSVGSAFFMIPTLIVSAFSLVYLPFLALERTGPFECLADCARAIPENIPAFLSGLGILTLVVLTSTVAMFVIGAGATLLISSSQIALAITVGATMSLALFFLFTPIYWIVGTLIYRKMQLESSSDEGWIEMSRPDEPYHAHSDAHSDGFIHKSNRPAPEPISIELEEEAFISPPKNEPAQRTRHAGPTREQKRRAPDSSEYLGLPVDDSLFGEFSDLPEDPSD